VRASARNPSVTILTVSSVTEGKDFRVINGQMRMYRTQKSSTLPLTRGLHIFSLNCKDGQTPVDNSSLAHTTPPFLPTSSLLLTILSM
jgi:hypothetical protein